MAVVTIDCCISCQPIGTGGLSDTSGVSMQHSTLLGPGQKPDTDVWSPSAAHAAVVMQSP
jgi:hypothetical protein